MIKKNILIFATFILTVAYSQQNKSDLHFGPKKDSAYKNIDNIVAIVGDDVITKKELSFFPKEMRQKALQHLIIKNILLQTAKKYNINIGDTAINIALENIAKNSPNKKITRSDLRDELIINNLRQQVVNSLVKIQDHELSDIVDEKLKNISDEVKLVDVLIKLPDNADKKTLKKIDKIKDNIINKLKSYQAKEVVKNYDNVFLNDLGWVSLSRVPTPFSKVLIDLPSNKYSNPIIDIDGIHILKIVDRKSYKDKFSIPQTLVSHILIKDKDESKAKLTIDSIYNKLKNGKKFSDLAKRYSQDLGSASKGGNLGWVSPGQMVPSFDAMIGKIKVGDISKPFKSIFGYHIIKVNDKRHHSISNRKSIELQARNEIFQRKASKEWDLWLAHMREEAYVKILDKNF